LIQTGVLVGPRDGNAAQKEAAVSSAGGCDEARLESRANAGYRELPGWDGNRVREWEPLCYRTNTTASLIRRVIATPRSPNGCAPSAVLRPARRQRPRTDFGRSRDDSLYQAARTTCGDADWRRQYSPEIIEASPGRVRPSRRPRAICPESRMPVSACDKGTTAATVHAANLSTIMAAARVSRRSSLHAFELRCSTT
jgi:hypothetical protein